MWSKDQAIHVLDRRGYVVDIGQLSTQAKRWLNYLAIRGIVTKGTTYLYPTPKTIWEKNDWVWE